MELLLFPLLIIGLAFSYWIFFVAPKDEAAPARGDIHFDETKDMEESAPPMMIPSNQWLPIVNDSPDIYPHLFLVGKTRSGKTLTCQAIIARRTGKICLIDPKDRPGKWGIRAIALDDDLSYARIEHACQTVLDLLKRRQKEMNNGSATFEQLTIVIDELPIVVSECPTAVMLFKKVGQIGAELNVRLIALSQSDRVKTLGLTGEGDSRDNYLFLAFGNKARDIVDIYNVTYPCVAKLDSQIALFATRDVPHLARLGIVPERIWEAQENTVFTPQETAKTANGNALDSTPEAGKNSGGNNATHGNMEDWQQQAILALAKEKVSRRKICERVFGSSGGRDYEKVKEVLDEAGL